MIDVLLADQEVAVKRLDKPPNSTLGRMYTVGGNNGGGTNRRPTGKMEWLSEAHIALVVRFDDINSERQAIQ
ncbi:MAG: hypothetical protein O7E52_16965 [Candidatus Poribacteria bacterium]|nr:hypothetical protein [Candidatus Poribacteria bacterium]